MTEKTKVQHRPQRPVLIFDGECNFCYFWIRRWQRITGSSVEYIPSQDPKVAERFPEIPRERFDAAVQLVELNGDVMSGAEAAFRTLSFNPGWIWLLWLYQHVPGFAQLSELFYGFVAGHRPAFSRLTTALFGKNPEPPTYIHVRAAFLRALGLIYLIAFASLWFQIQGLLGTRGILPAQEYMSAAGRFFDKSGQVWNRYHLLPTFCWISASDSTLQLLCGIGTVCSVLLMVGISPTLSAFLLWSIYLSLSVVGREFLSFQWDVLLLEAGFLAIFFAPLRWLLNGAEESSVSRTMLWLLRWLVFRLMFESGCVKLLSGDMNWWTFKALRYHYETQPLPTWIGWFCHQLPAWFQSACVGALFGIELGLPLLIFAPRRLRFIAGIGFGVLQFWILLTGNYGFFNYLTLALLLILLDDAALARILPRAWGRRSESRAALLTEGDTMGPINAPRAGFVTPRWPRWWNASVAIVILFVSTTQLAAVFRLNASWLQPAAAVAEWLAPFRSFNSYGLFAVMTTSRPEIVIEGSDDRQVWKPYQFKYKPGDLATRPPFVAPYQPRLDWQMWFAALGSYRENPWFVAFCVRLLQGSPNVLGMLKTNPFEHAPPLYVRAKTYQYHFTTWSEHAQSGAWWKRELQDDYLPPISLQDIRSTEHRD